MIIVGGRLVFLGLIIVIIIIGYVFNRIEICLLGFILACGFRCGSVRDFRNFGIDDISLDIMSLLIFTGG